MRTVLSAGVLALSLAATAHAEVDWKQVEQVFGRPAAEQPGGVDRFDFPRSDLKVTLDGIEIKPALALGSWLPFPPTGGVEAMVMGDLVLTEEEVNPVMARPRRGRDRRDRGPQSPAARPARHHVHAHRGSWRPVAARPGTTAGARAEQYAGSPPAGAGRGGTAGAELDTAALESTSATRARRAAASISSLSPVARRSSTAAWGCRRPWAPASRSISSRGGEQAAATGDFVLTAEEVNPVLRDAPRARHRGHGPAQPHDEGGAAALLHALLGPGRRRKTRRGP